MTEFSFALIADPHLSAEPTVQSGRLAHALAEVTAGRHEFVVFLGDMTADGQPESYHHFLRLLDLTGLKCHFVRGNNENQGPDDTRFYDFLGKCRHAFECGRWRFVCLDTSACKIDDEQFAWLERALGQNAGGLPVAAFGHHYLECLTEESRARLLGLMEAAGVRHHLCAHQHLDRTAHFGSVEQRVLTCLDPLEPKQGVAGYYLVTAGPSALQLELVPAPTARLGSLDRSPHPDTGRGFDL